MNEPEHKCKFTIRVKRKIPLFNYGATTKNVKPKGIRTGFDYLLVWKCKCGKGRAADILERQLA